MQHLEHNVNFISKRNRKKTHLYTRTQPCIADIYIVRGHKMDDEH